MKAKNGFIVRINRSMVRRLRDRQPGQLLVLIALWIFGLLALTAVVIDVGRLYFGYEQLVAQTQAAALGAGTVLANSTIAEAENVATSYSGKTGDANANASLLTNVAISYTGKCLNTLMTEGILCTASPSNNNAITVTETATVPTSFARILGITSWNISATATAAAQGGGSNPYSVAIILDTTSSMNTADGDATNCGTESRITCALAGIQVLLNSLSPCPGGAASCGSTTDSTVDLVAPASGTETAVNVAAAGPTYPVDEVSLFVFPGLTSTSQVSNDLGCPAKSPAITSYNGYFNYTLCTAAGVPAACCTGKGLGNCNSTVTPPIYQIVPLSSDFRTSDTAALNTSSNIVIATGGAPSCSPGVAAPGGEETFYAGAIDAAQAQLVAQTRPNTQNVIIILSDGNASATATEGLKPTTPPPSWAYSTNAQCQQAVNRAQAAALAGTTIYTVAYGAAASGCTAGDTLTPCETMEDMALQAGSSTPYNANFFSDYTAAGSVSTCISASHTSSSLNQIFKEIYYSLTVARLVPNSTS